MVIIAGHHAVDAVDRDRYVAAFRDLVVRSREADGCIDVAITADSVDPERVNVLEVWESAAALDAWRAQANPPDIDVEPDEDSMRVRRFEARDGGPLF